MLYLSGIIIAFFLSFLLFSKKHKTTADYVLATWIAITGFHLLTFYLMLTRQFTTYPALIAIGFALPLVQGPFLFLYTLLQTSSASFQKKHWLHFLPVVLSWLLFIEFYFLPFGQKVEVFNQKGRGFESAFRINLIAIYVSGIVYIILSLNRLMRYRKNIVHQFSNTEKINFNWLLYLIIWMAVIWITVLFVQQDEWIFGAAALFIVWLGYFGIRQVQVFTRQKQDTAPQIFIAEDSAVQKVVDSVAPEQTEEENQPVTFSVSGKYQKSALTEEDISDMHEKLKELLDRKKPYRNADLTLPELSGMLDIQPNHLSQVINSREKKNFYDLINEKRVEEFIRLLSKPGSKQYTLLSLAFECGFNSKASFNRNFKKYTGLSPRDYQKQQQMA